MARDRLLTFEELHRVATLLVTQAGIDDIRLTGGEPLVRREIEQLVEMLARIPGLKDLSLTTNGILLADHAQSLRDAGLRRLNISLDTLDEETFQRITRRSGVDRVIEGIDSAINAGFDSIKLNTIAVRGITEAQIVDLVRFASDRDVMLRFIEFMPLDTDQAWESDAVLTGDGILAILDRNFGGVREAARPHPSQPAEEFEIANGQRFGIIRSVTAPFCHACNRIRITSDGAIRNCLFSNTEVSIREMLRTGANDQQILTTIRQCVANKKRGHGIDEEGFRPPDRPMYSIGG